MRDGIASNKSDIYAFGVVLFEMVSGKEAMTRSSERRSLVSIVSDAASKEQFMFLIRHALTSVNFQMVAVLRNSSESMKDHVDPNLMNLYPHDCLFKVAMLAKQCVEEDPILRPDMKQVVMTLSQILLSSVEWESTLAGNSQVFSGLVQGR